MKPHYPGRWVIFHAVSVFFYIGWGLYFSPKEPPVFLFGGPRAAMLLGRRWGPFRLPLPPSLPSWKPHVPFILHGRRQLLPAPGRLSSRVFAEHTPASCSFLPVEDTRADPDLFLDINWKSTEEPLKNWNVNSATPSPTSLVGAELLRLYIFRHVIRASPRFSYSKASWASLPFPFTVRLMNILNHIFNSFFLFFIYYVLNCAPSPFIC